MDFLSAKPSVKVVRILVLLSLMAFCQIPVSAQTDTSGHYVSIGSIGLSGNKKTREQIIYRELLLEKGVKYTSDDFRKRVNQSRLNLLNTSLFNFVTIDTFLIVDAANPAMMIMNVKITLLERWFIWPVPILQITDRNFNAWWQTRDFTRINYGLDTKWYNFTGRMDELDAVIQFGKNHQIFVAYQNPYIDRHKHFGLGFEAGYRNNREAGFITRNDKLIYAFVPEGLSVEKYFALNFSYRKDIFITHQLIAGLHEYHFTDSLLVLNREYSYEGIHNPAFFRIFYKLKIDHRDIQYYPLKGWYADLELSESGLGFKFEKPVSVGWAKTTARLYSKLASRWYTGISFIGKMSTSALQPYFLIQGLGYNRDYVRGYEYNVIDGKHFALVRSNLKYSLVPEHTRDIGFIPTPKFGRIHYALYLTAFADAAYVWQPQWSGQNNNNLPRTLLAGAGFGVDLVTYYDKVVRIEYAFNKSGKNGIFIHFIAGI